MPKTITQTIYTIDELSPEARQHAIDSLRDINVDHSWYDYLLDNFAEDAEKIGIVFEGKNVCFSLDRDACVYVDGANVSLNICDVTKTVRTISPYIYRRINDGSIEPDYSFDKGARVGTGRREFPRIEWGRTSGSKVNIHLGYGDYWPRNEDKIFAILDAAVTDILCEFERLCIKYHDILDKEYDYHVSDERVTETIRANDYWFYDDGVIARLAESS